MTDIWELHNQGHVAIIPTNMQLKGNSVAVMGAGLAKQCAERFPNIAKFYGVSLTHGRIVDFYLNERLLLLPTKIDWRGSADMALITYGIRSAVCIWHNNMKQHYESGIRLALPQIGSGLGGFRWKDVHETIKPLLSDDVFILC